MTIRAVAAGTATVTVTAHDRASGGLSVDQSFTVTVPNRPPVVDKEIDDLTLTVGANRGVGLLDKFRDPDGDTLRYTANSSAAGVATVSVRGGTLTIMAAGAGTTMVTVTAPPPVPGKRGVPLRYMRRNDTIRRQHRRRWYRSRDREVRGGTLTIMAAGAGTTMVTVTAHDRAVGVSGGLDVDQDFTVTVELPPLVEVANFTAMPGSAHGEIALDWDPVDGADSYEVGQWQLQPGNLYDYEVLDDSEVTIDLQATSAVVRGLTPSFTYTHSVRAVRGVGSDKVVGDWAVGQDAAAHDESPETPTVFVVAQTIGGRGISLSWKAAMGAADYEAEASSTGGTSLDIAPGLTTGFTGLVPGDSYSFRVRSRKPHDGGHLFSDWTAALTVSGPTPTHWWGHQADHTVGYVLALATTTDPLLQAAIPVAVAEWNGRMNFGLMICDTADSACRVRNSDRFIATIKTVAPSSPSDNVTGCGSSMACVSPTSGGVGAPGGVGDHMTNMDVIFEDPPYTCANDMDPCQVGDQVTYTWTDVSRLSHEEVTAGDPTHLYLHAKHLALHELGHTLGLPDFYFVPAPHPAANYDPRLASETAIMNLQWEAKSIQDTDIAQLDAIYLLHSSHSAR